ncbi:MAG: hypothetical protein FRX48_04086 [Lasallia pustulata]|uniref:Uncharacterized protein n=1 Tax=Lasallia pustulata TaxID=136370 RepID=A0A5M8PTB8_9LECA|nr:MAG: hypothetical protein FRX48_04086 [Lasallia pustulata]
MDRTSVQDFQLYHNPHTIPPAKNPEPNDHAIESIEQYTSEDESPSASLPPSSDPDDAIFDRASHPASPATSRHSSDDISTLPSSPHTTSPPLARHPPSPFTPLKPRSPFRNPSSHDLLLEKTTPTVLARGILIPHPRDDYDLLEERLLEALDLCPPRILPCGHFHPADPDPDTDTDPDPDLCATCNRRIQLPRGATAPAPGTSRSTPRTG